MTTAEIVRSLAEIYYVHANNAEARPAEPMTRADVYKALAECMGELAQNLQEEHEAQKEG